VRRFAPSYGITRGLIISISAARSASAAISSFAASFEVLRFEPHTTMPPRNPATAQNFPIEIGGHAIEIGDHAFARGRPTETPFCGKSHATASRRPRPCLCSPLAPAIPLHWIVAAQIYRVGGGIFLVLWADRRLPWQFALPAGIGDVTTGCFAVVVAALLAKKAAGARRAAYGWSFFGIADLVVAITMGAITSPGRPHLFAFEAPNLLISSHPLVMVPTFAVPLALMLHGLVLWRLRRETASTGGLAEV
jgi:hypothetical protein